MTSFREKLTRHLYFRVKLAINYDGTEQLWQIWRGNFLQCNYDEIRGFFTSSKNDWNRPKIMTRIGQKLWRDEPFYEIRAFLHKVSLYCRLVLWQLWRVFRAFLQDNADEEKKLERAYSLSAIGDFSSKALGSVKALGSSTNFMTPCRVVK
jgi:hypothetical protein